MLRGIETTKSDMTRHQGQNVLGIIISYRCPLTITEDMVGKEIVVNVTQRGQGDNPPMSFMLLENV